MSSPPVDPTSTQDQPQPSPSASPGSSPKPASQPINPLKRKRPDDDNDRSFTPPADGPSPNMVKSEYHAGRVLCEVCGDRVSFRDEDTGGFTLKHWNDHRESCIAPSPTPAASPGNAAMCSPEIAAGGDMSAHTSGLHSQGHPPVKRRRAKRTEEERIEYLRADPYVAQFEAYRVLCASCDKWIRLRPNSTYCSIPWDAHRKSCLAKKINSKNVYALEERNSIFSKDLDVRKFDAERVLCNICDQWLSVSPDDHLDAVQVWLQHRDACQKASGNPNAARSTATPTGESGSGPGPSPSQPQTSTSPLIHTLSITGPPSASRPHSPTDSARHFHDLNPANYAPAHESRRRNAEQRAATLRADTLIGTVEPNRVFCTLCQKWVQLRQDSSYCAYPWLQHRGKCLARHQRRAQKAAEIAEARAKKYGHSTHTYAHAHPPHPHPHVNRHQLQHIRAQSLVDAEGDPEPEPESEEGVDDPRSPVQVKAEHDDAGAQVPEERREHHASGHPHRQHYSGREHGQQRHSQPQQVYHAPHPAQRHPPPPPGHSVSHHHPYRHHHHGHHQQKPYARHSHSHGHGHGHGHGYHRAAPPPPPAHRHQSHPGQQQHRVIRAWNAGVVSNPGRDAEGDADPDADVDAEGDADVEEGAQVTPTGEDNRRERGPVSAVVGRKAQPGLADLDSVAGRRQFIHRAIRHLCATTYEPMDDMKVSALLTYLNAAAPPDKHEDFDTAEVVRALGVLQQRGCVCLEGDVIRPV